MTTQARTPQTPAGVASDSYGTALPFGLHHLTRVMNALGTLWILGLMVLINADAQASHQSVVNVMQAARLAGIARINFAAQNSP